MKDLIKMKKKEMKNNLTPTGIKIISIYYYFLAGVSVFIASFVGQIVGAQVLIAGLLLSLVLIAGAVLYVFIGIYLWKGKNWARLLVIIFSILFFIEELYALIVKNSFINLFSLVINLIILFYLLFSKEVKNFFQVGFSLQKPLS